ncbi:hypothetical protein DPMN_008497 [Dreissena polymorpha]|uniref:Uncharacterized protein n=1 Tax=Dreissena polymorpha TaxID=45954 RepID=A0A9D4MYW3_DREPO|nr:hypothetical protein DPMN_008497 [Dreissena polymorpha]
MFHEDWTKNLTSRVLTGFYYICHWGKNHDDQTINIACRVLINFYYSHIDYEQEGQDGPKNCPPPPPGTHVIQLTGTILKLYSHIKETNVLTKFHENWAKNVTSRVFTCFHYIHIEKNAPPTGGHVFAPIWIIFKLVRDINKTNVLTNFHDDWAKLVTSRVFTRKTALPTGGHVFQWTGTTFELIQDIIKTNILTNFELDQDFIGTKLLTKFHEYWTINVASRVFTNKCGRTDRRRTKTGHKRQFTYVTLQKVTSGHEGGCGGVGVGTGDGLGE